MREAMDVALGMRATCPIMLNRATNAKATTSNSAPSQHLAKVKGER